MYMTQEIITQISETVGTEVFGIWFLIGAAFVFFMQAGFAMVEDLSDFRHWEFSQTMQILTGLILYSTLSSVQQRQRLYQERWLKEQNSFPIVSTQE